MDGDDLLAGLRLVGRFGEKAGQILRDYRVIGRSIIDNRFCVTNERRVCSPRRMIRNFAQSTR